MGMGIGTGWIPTTDNISETTEKLGCPTDYIPETTDLLKIKLNTCRNNRNFISIYFKTKCQSECKI